MASLELSGELSISRKYLLLHRSEILNDSWSLTYYHLAAVNRKQ